MTSISLKLGDTSSEIFADQREDARRRCTAGSSAFARCLLLRRGFARREVGISCGVRLPACSGSSWRQSRCPSMPAAQSVGTGEIQIAGVARWRLRIAWPMSRPDRSRMANGPMAMPKLRSALSTCCGVAPSSRGTPLAAVLEDHAVADETVADDHHRDLLQPLADGLAVASTSLLVFAPRTTSSRRMTRRAEKVQADHVFRPFGEGGDGVDPAMTYRGEDRTGLAHGIQLFEDLLDAHFLEPLRPLHAPAARRTR